MGRFFRALFYYISGQFIWGAKSLEKDPHVIEARYDSVLGKLHRRLVAAKDAVGGIVAQRERRKGDLEKLIGQETELQETLEGAEALAAERMKELRKAGKPDEEILADADYKSYSAAYADAESSLAAVRADIDRVKEDIAQLSRQADDYLIQLRQMQREIQEVERKKHVTIADVSMSTQVQELQDALSGIQSSGVAKELASLDELRLKARADAEVSRKVSGADVKLEAAKLRAAAHQARAGSKLAAKLGLGVAQATEKPAAAAPAKAEAVGTGGSKPSGGLPG
ncbi:hypothetical protein HY635_03750 [Candidatus Uhrbacteria bacterium]|nr:hypothetical protein [Candidatus Uhrbacteria bacterium]